MKKYGLNNLIASGKKIALVTLLATALSQNVNACNEKYAITDTRTPTEKRNDALKLLALFFVGEIGQFALIYFWASEQHKIQENIKRKQAEKQNKKIGQKQR